MSKPKIRIVHPGGPASMAQVFYGDEPLENVTLVSVHLDANDPNPVKITLGMDDADLDIVGEPQMPSDEAEYPVELAASNWMNPPQQITVNITSAPPAPGQVAEHIQAAVRMAGGRRY